ncbi:MAG: alpha/beta fold hydrolase [Alphaproteobacteria bacterium]|nr:alpha/beta fold hydrolase [Alphaproteobacteria bacterium]
MKLSRRQVLAGSASIAAFVSSLPRSPRAMSADIRTWRQYASGGWGQIHLWMAEPMAGPGNLTPLVCMHQSPTSGAYYKEFQAVMATDRLVISPDTPGYGGSDAPPSMPDMEDYGRAVAVGLENLGYGKDGKGPVDILGFHTGNFVAMEIARQRPDLVRRLVMPGIPYYPKEEREAKRVQYAQPRPYFTDPEYLAQSYLNGVYHRDFGVPKDRHLEMFVERLRAGLKSHYGFDAVFRYDPDPVLKTLDQPTLLPILNETLAEPTRNAGQMIQNKVFVDLMDLDGWAWFTAPERIAAVVRPFLDKI